MEFELSELLRERDDFPLSLLLVRMRLPDGARRAEVQLLGLVCLLLVGFYITLTIFGGVWSALLSAIR